jgi:hypothetical protein
LNRPESHPTEKPFARLVRLFLDRAFHGGDDSGAEEIDLGLGMVLSLLALPGLLYSALLFEKYSTLLLWMRGQHNFDPVKATVPDEYFLIVLSMVVTGAVAVWQWDSLFPDRRDYMNLAPLPISTPVIFLANLSAIVCIAGLLVLDVNAASALLYPLAASASQQSFRFFAQLAGVHVLAVVLASVFSFFAVMAAAGLLMTAVPYAAFRKISLYVRGATIVLLVGLLTTAFAVPPMIGDSPPTFLRFLPPVWFLALTQLVHGGASATMAGLGWTAVEAVFLAITVAMVGYSASYRKCFVRTAEMAGSDPQLIGLHGARISALLEQMVFRTPLQQAGQRFLFKTLLRSERHSVVLAGFAGLGIVVASLALFGSINARPSGNGFAPSPELLSIPLILSYCLLVGLRFAFEIPIELRANWIFRLSLAKDTRECVSLTQRAMLVFVIPWVVVMVFPICAYVWDWRIAALHAAFVALWSWVLTQVLLLRFRKLPFTCSFPPFRHSAIVMALSYVLGFFVFVAVLSNLEYQALLHPLFAIVIFLCVPGARYVLFHLRAEIAEFDKQLIFEERGTVGYDWLDLEQRL